MAILLLKNLLVDSWITVHTDNRVFVSVLNKLSSRSPRVMTLVIPLVLKCRVNNTYFKVQHTCIVGYINVIGDFISRRQWTRFCVLVPESNVYSFIVFSRRFYTNNLRAEIKRWPFHSVQSLCKNKLSKMLERNTISQWDLQAINHTYMYK